MTAPPTERCSWRTQRASRRNSLSRRFGAGPFRLPAAAAACIVFAGIFSCPVASADSYETLQGYVTDAAGNPITGATVFATDCGYVPTSCGGPGTPTDQTGHYSMIVGPATTYNVYVAGFGTNSPASQTVTVPIQSGQTVRQDFTFTPPAGDDATLTVDTHDATGLPISYGALTVQATTGQSSSFSIYSDTGPQGTTTFHDLPAGTYTATVDATTSDVGQGTAAASLQGGAPVTLAVTLPPLFPSPAVGGVNAQRDLAWLSAERAAQGLPADIQENPRWSAECQAHNVWEEANHALDHDESLGTPGYSAAGNWAGQHSDLAVASWTGNGDPWENAPLHLLQLFTPSLSVIGISDDGSRTCATTWPGLVGPEVATETVSTYPGNGATGIPPAEDAEESPEVPGQEVGIPAGTTAGRELFVYLDEPGERGPAGVQILGASLASETSSVPVRWVDKTNPNLEAFLTGGIIIPVTPLAAYTTYTARVTVEQTSGEGVPWPGASPVTHTWTFTTGSANASPAPPPQPAAVTSVAIDTARSRIRHGSVSITLTCRASLQQARCKGVLKLSRQVRRLVRHRSRGRIRVVSVVERVVLASREYSLGANMRRTFALRVNERLLPPPQSHGQPLRVTAVATNNVARGAQRTVMLIW